MADHVVQFVVWWGSQLSQDSKANVGHVSVELTPDTPTLLSFGSQGQVLEILLENSASLQKRRRIESDTTYERGCSVLATAKFVSRFNEEEENLRCRAEHRLGTEQLSASLHLAEQHLKLIEAEQDCSGKEDSRTAIQGYVSSLKRLLEKRVQKDSLLVETKINTHIFTVHLGSIVDLVGVPENCQAALLTRFHSPLSMTDCKSVTMQRTIPVEELPIRGVLVREVALPERPFFIALHDGCAYITFCDNVVRVYNLTSCQKLREWALEDDEDEEHDLRGVVVADNKLFVCDFGNSCIRVYCLGGRHINTWKPIFDGKVAQPLAVAAQGLHLYVTDFANNRVLVLDLEGNVVHAFGSPGSGPGQFNECRGLCVHGNQLYVVDCGNFRVQVFTLSGQFKLQFGCRGEGPGMFAWAVQIAVRSEGKWIYVTDQENENIQVFNADGTYSHMWGYRGTDEGTFANPRGFALAGGFAYVCQLDRKVLQVWK